MNETYKWNIYVYSLEDCLAYSESLLSFCVCEQPLWIVSSHEFDQRAPELASEAYLPYSLVLLCVHSCSKDMNLREGTNPKWASSTCPAVATAGRKIASSLLFKEFLRQMCTQLLHPLPAGREQACTAKSSGNHAITSSCKWDPPWLSRLLTSLPSSFFPFFQEYYGMGDIS